MATKKVFMVLGFIFPFLFLLYKDFQEDDWRNPNFIKLSANQKSDFIFILNELLWLFIV
jgi:hypothetical protein